MAEEKKDTRYVVLASEEEHGPYSVVGEFTGAGQAAAKKEAVAKVGEEAGGLYFIAIPKSSFAPQKPAIKTQISF